MGEDGVEWGGEVVGSPVYLSEKIPPPHLNLASFSLPLKTSEIPFLIPLTLLDMWGFIDFSRWLPHSVGNGE